MISGSGCGPREGEGDEAGWERALVERVAAISEQDTPTMRAERE